MLPSCLVFGQKSSTKGPRGTLPLGCVTDATPPTASPVGIVGRLVTMPTMEGEMTSFLATFLWNPHLHSFCWVTWSHHLLYLCEWFHTTFHTPYVEWFETTVYTLFVEWFETTIYTLFMSMISNQYYSLFMWMISNHHLHSVYINNFKPPFTLHFVWMILMLKNLKCYMELAFAITSNLSRAVRWTG